MQRIKQYFDARTADQLGGTHGQTKTYRPDLMQQRTLGPQPELDPINNPVHRAMLAATETHGIETLEITIEQKELQLAAHGSPTPLRMGQMTVFGIECLGCMLIFHEMGLSLLEVLAFGTSLASMLFVLTRKVNQ